MRRTWWKSGGWNALCGQCGQARKDSQLQERWDGLMVCRPSVKPGCWELRHPQDLIRPIPDQPGIPWSRPDSGLARGGTVVFQPVEYGTDGEGTTIPTSNGGGDNSQGVPCPPQSVTLTTSGSYNLATLVNGACCGGLTVNIAQGISINLTLGCGCTGATSVNIYNYGNLFIQNPCDIAHTIYNLDGGSSSFSLGFLVQPSNTLTIDEITPPVQVAMYDPQGNVFTLFTGDIEIAIGANPGGGTLTGTTTVTAVAGIVVFDDLNIDAGGTSYTLIASTDGVSDLQSSAFNISVPTLAQSSTYTLGGSDVWATVDYLRNAVCFYNGVLYINHGPAGQASHKIAVFNLASQSTPISDVNLGAYRPILGLIDEETLPPGYGFFVASGASFYRMDFNGTVQSANSGFGNADGLNYTVSEESQSAIFSPTRPSLARWTNVNWGVGTATLNSNFGSLNPTYYVQELTLNGGVIDSRVYLQIATNLTGSAVTPYYLAWIHSGTGALTTLATFANPVCASILAGSFGGGPDTVLYNLSGNAGEANVLQKRDLNGVLLSTCTLTGMSSSDFTLYKAIMSYDSANDMLWIQKTQGNYPLYCVRCSDMTLVLSGDPSPKVKLIPYLGHPSGGVVCMEVDSPTNRLYRLYVG